MSTPIRFKGLVKTTAEIESDKFSGRIGYNTTLARYVVYYNATQYATLARNDVLETFAQGVQDSTLTDGQIVQAGGSGRLRSDSGLTSAQSGGATITETVGSGSSDANVGFIANGKSGYSKSFVCRTNGSTRWSWGADNSVESGANAGSKFFLTARDDAGVIIDDVISVVRAPAGVMTFGGTTLRPANFTGGVSAGYLQISLTPSGTPATAGTFSWNATDKTADLIQPDGVTLQLGQETQVLALNNTGSTIANGAVVRISGASGQRVTIELADADVVGKEDAIGVTTQSITNNQTGKVTIIGLVRDIDTSAFSEGASVYLSTTAGELVATPPAYPGRIVKVGIVSRSHATQGSLFVHCDYLGGYVTREAAVVNIPGTASSAPSLGNFVDANMQVRRFNGSATQNDLYYSIDVDHDYVAGTDMVFHTHWTPTDTAGGNVRWQIYYQWVESGATWTAATLAGATTAAGTTAWADKRTDFTISGAGHTYNSRLLIHLFRNPSDAADTYGSDAALIAASAHYISKPDQAG